MISHVELLEKNILMHEQIVASSEEESISRKISVTMIWNVNEAWFEASSDKNRGKDADSTNS